MATEKLSNFSLDDVNGQGAILVALQNPQELGVHMRRVREGRPDGVDIPARICFLLLPPLPCPSLSGPPSTSPPAPSRPASSTRTPPNPATPQ